ncbi:hypothetical protein PG985_002588 [Apiospora marii]|uniref:Uncharacterized protein n=1 Tax=Apiospora marii TaxID=335849 RepID=A0ABR1RUG5_9PEZI
MSTLAPHLVTQCFFDTVLAPMPTFLFLLSLPGMIIASWWRRRRGGRTTNYLYPRSSPYPFPLSGGGGGNNNTNPSNTRRYPTTSRQPPATLLKHKLPALGYYGAVVVVLLMQSVEIVQLERASLGVGLLPVAYAGAASAALLRLADRLWLGTGTDRSPLAAFVSDALSPFWVASVFLWTGSAAVAATKTIALVTGLGLGGTPNSRDQTPYPVVHQFVDLVIVTVFYALAAAGEVGMTILRGKERRAARVDGIEEDAVQLRESFANAAPVSAPAPPTTNTNK